jgi:hypothetical protein
LKCEQLLLGGWLYCDTLAAVLCIGNTVQFDAGQVENTAIAKRDFNAQATRK